LTQDKKKTKAGKVQTGRKRPRAHFSRCLPHFLIWPPFFKMAGAFFNVAAIFQDGSGFFAPHAAPLSML